MAYFATGNLDHNQESFKRGDQIDGLSDGEIKTLLDIGAITESADQSAAVAADPAATVVEHPNPTGEVQPSTVPHPVTTEQARIEADFQNQATTEAEVANGPAEQAAQPSPEEIAATLAATGEQQPQPQTVAQPQVVQQPAPQVQGPQQV